MFRNDEGAGQEKWKHDAHKRIIERTNRGSTKGAKLEISSEDDGKKWSKSWCSSWHTWK